MTDAATAAKAYIDTWNATDAAQRRALIAERWSQDATYVDPLGEAKGADAIDALIDSVQQRFPGFRFTLAGAADGHGNHVRFTWELGPDGAPAPIQGTDYVRLEGGRLAQVTGFLDRVPAA